MIKNHLTIGDTTELCVAKEIDGDGVPIYFEQELYIFFQPFMIWAVDFDPAWYGIQGSFIHLARGCKLTPTSMYRGYA